MTVVVRVLKAADADFAAIPGMASVNDILYGTEGESQDVAITGLTSDMTVRDVGEDNDAIYGEDGAGNLVTLKYLLAGQIQPSLSKALPEAETFQSCSLSVLIPTRTTLTELVTETLRMPMATWC